MTLKYVVVDTETTGLDPKIDKVVEIAAAWRHKSQLLYASNLINPGITIPPDVSAVTHLTDDDVKDAPSVEHVIKDPGFPEGIIVAHNAKFDQAFLPELSNRQWLCTMRCAMHLYPDSPNYKNMTLRYYLKLKPDLPENLAPHRALYDTLVTMAIFEKMLEEHSIEELLELQSKPVLLKTVRFGKHKGSLWQNVPKDYLRWMLAQDDSGGIGADERYTARNWYSQ